MKKSKLLIVASIAGLSLTVVAAGAGCSEEDEHIHTYGEWSITTAPTETTEGEATRTCTDNDGGVETFKLPALSDTSFWTVDIVQASHTTDGKTVYSSDYGTVEITIPSGEHTFADEWTITKAPTLTEGGTATRYCTAEDGGEDTIDIPALTDATVWTKDTENSVEPTHTAAGKTVYTSVYGTVEVEVAATAHEFGEWTITKAPTLTEGGTATRYCTADDGGEDTIDIPALTDATVWAEDTENSVEPTHTAAGKTVYTSVYGTVEVEIAVTAHEFGEWSITKEPTLTEGGTATRYCTADDGGEDTIDIPALTDATVWTKDTENSVEPTHTAAGKTVYTSVYGTVEVEVAAAAHEYGEWTIIQEPTLTEGGRATHYCTADDGGEETIDIPALTDASVWSVESTSPTYNEGSTSVYTSEYGSVTVKNDDKLVAPYDNTTYYNFGIGESETTGSKFETSWTGAELALDDNGSGLGTSYPYRYYVSISMADAATGKISIKFVDWDYTNDQFKEDGKEYTYSGYVDYETGIIVFYDGRYWFVLTPYTVQSTSNTTDEETGEVTSVIVYSARYTTATTSAWTYTDATGFNRKAIAVGYEYEDGNVLNIYINDSDGTVYFGVDFVDEKGNAIDAGELYNNPYVYVKSGEDIIASFGYNGEKQVTLDGLEGVYTADGADLTLSGFGVATLGEVNGTYSLADEGADYDIDLYIGGEYFEVTLTDGGYSTYKPMVTVTLNGNGEAADSEIYLNKNIATAIPSLDNTEYMTFKGWYYDAACTLPVGDDFTPVSEVTLYASWKAKVVVNVVIDNETTSTLYLGEGDVIGDELEAEFNRLGFETLDEDKMVMFDGWYILVDDEKLTLSGNEEISEGDSGLTVYASWKVIPAYYGTYQNAGEIYNAGYNIAKTTALTIDENGKMSGFQTGIIVSYDPETQLVTWKTSETATTTYSFWFDAATGLIAGLYNNTQIGNDYYLFSKYKTVADGKAEAVYGVHAPKTPESTNPNDGFYAQFARIETKLGVLDVLMYNNHIYSNVIIKNALGETLTTSEIENSKTVIVRDADTGEIIVSVASVGTSFKASSTVQFLDEYFGTYTFGDESVILDGTGTAVYGDKSGTYTNVGENEFDVYILEDGVETEYYLLTLNGSECTMDKVMVTLTYVSDYDQPDSVSVNKNIAVTLPEMSNTATHVFRGWYVGETQIKDGYIPETDTEITALWLEKVVLTVNYNLDTIDDITVEYGAGETVEIDNPKTFDAAFAGWFTTPTFDEGTEWISGTVIEEDIVIYAKWGEAPAYAGVYYGYEIWSASSKGTSAHTITIEPDGTVTWKLGTSETATSYVGTVTEYDEDTQMLTWDNNGTTRYMWFDQAGKVIVCSYYVGGTANNYIPYDLYIYLPGEANVDVSITDYFSLNVVFNGSTGYFTKFVSMSNADGAVTVFINDSRLYTGVTITDGIGNPLTISGIANSKTVVVLDADGNEVFAAASSADNFGTSGYSVILLDSYRGTYEGSFNGEEASVILDGAGNIAIGEITGTYLIADDGSVDVYIVSGEVNEYYTIILNTEDGTYTADKPEVTVGFVTDYSSADDVTVNKNIVIALPVLEDTDHVFRGWYVQGDDTQTLVSQSYLPEADVTLVAKWDIKVTLTVVYGNGLDDVTIVYGVGDTIEPVTPPFTNNKVFNGWYTDAEFTEAYTVGVITEDMTIYCDWLEAVEQYGSYSGWNLYSTGNTTTSTFSHSITISPDGNVSGSRKGTIEQGENGVFTIVNGSTTWYAYYESTLGIIWYAYSSSGNSESVGTDTYFLMSGNVSSVGQVRYGGNVDGSAYTALLKITYSDGSVHYVVGYNNVVYADVTWDENIEFSSISNTTPITVRDSEGNLIYSIS